MEQKTHDILLELKNGKDAQTAAWLSHPANYDDLVDDIALQGQGGASQISNALTNLAGEDVDSDIYQFSTDIYPNFLKDVVSGFATEVTEYTADSAREKAVIYAPALPINKTNPQGQSLAYCFYYCRWLTTIQGYNIEDGAAADAIATLSNLDNVTNANYMFTGCSQLVNIPEEWTFANLIDASAMFYGCKKMNKLPQGLSGNSIVNAVSMFRGCYALKSLPADFALQSATSITLCFQQCGIEHLPVRFQLGAATSFRRIFYGCRDLAFTTNGEKINPLLVFDVSNNSNGLSSGSYNSSNSNSSLYQLFYGCDAIGDGEILNEFTISAQAVGIKFDLYLHENGFEKLSAVSVVSLFDCLHAWPYDEDLDEFDYSDRFPNAAVAAATDTPQPTIYVTSAIFAQLTAAQKAIAGDKGWDVQAHL